MQKKHLYRQVPWDLSGYLWRHWYLWLGLLGIVLGAMALIFHLFSSNYFSHQRVEEKKQAVTILSFRSDIFTTVIVSNPFDNSKPYEVDLGYFCRVNPGVLYQSIPMTTVLYKRNYNQTFFIDYPDAKQIICKTP